MPGGIIAGTRQLAAVLLADPAGARGDPNSGPMLARTARRQALVATSACWHCGRCVAYPVVRGRHAEATLFDHHVRIGFDRSRRFCWPWLPISSGARRRCSSRSPGLAARRLRSLAAWGFNWTKYRRFGPHGCSKCGTQLELLSEQDEDPKLSSVQQLEEKIGSVDYDVWICPACLNQDTERYIKRFSGFTECPKCKAARSKRTRKRSFVRQQHLAPGRHGSTVAACRAITKRCETLCCR